MPRFPRGITDYGPDALLLNWEPRISPEISSSVHTYAHWLSQHPAVVECIPAYASLLVRYARPRTTAYRLKEEIFSFTPAVDDTSTGIHHDLPVCYHPDYAPDLSDVVAALKTTVKTLIKRHTAVTYLVYQLGYQPGFGFLGETDERLAVNRRGTPRRAVPAGSVGLAGRQTGVYPTASPGGWQLIGRCPTPLLRAGRNATRLKAGDTVRFHAISPDEFLRFDPTTVPWPKR